MSVRRWALATAAAVGLSPDTSRAATLSAGGSLELTISGFVAVQATGGALDNLFEDAQLANSLDFSTDSEIQILARGRSEDGSREYGAAIDFETDTSDTFNTGETWLFLNGGFGEVRLGDEDGAVDALALGGFSVAAGTGGIDGEVIDTLAIDAILPVNSDDATKIRYITPVLGGVSLGVSYTPNADADGSQLATDDVVVEHWVEAGLRFERELDSANIEASLVGSLASVDGRVAELWTAYAGLVVATDAVELGIGVGAEDDDSLERRYVNVGLGRAFGEVYASLTAGRVLHAKAFTDVGEPWNVALSADYGLFEGVVLAADLAYFDNDLDRAAREPVGGDSGLAWITRLEVAF